MLVAVEPRRFGKHKIYHIILQEVTKQSFGSRSSDFHLQSTLYANVWTGAKESNRITSIAQKLLLRGKEVLSHAHVCSLEQRVGNVHDQNEQTLHIQTNE